MIESHFGLCRRPFPATPDHSCYYPATGHERALGRLLDGLADGEGVLLLSAGPGLGKTLLCHCLLDRLGDDLQASLLTHTHLGGPAGLLQALLHDLSLPHEGRSEQDMRLALIDHLLGRYRDGKRTVLVIDEAQHLGPDLLEELRLLGNLEGQAGKAVQVVLAGQPELLATLGQPALAPLRQRVVVRAQIEPLGLEEAADYLLAHLRAAGGRAERILGMEALEVLGRQTGGVPRLLNQSARLALRLAAENSASEVDAEIALEALAQLGLTAAEPETALPEKEDPPPAGDEDSSYRLFLAPGRSA
jgi:type II secretory pathway predicted ATPase ExeA